MRSPTAAHQSSATQATPVRLLKTPVLGVRSSRQLLPSNDAAAVRTTSPLECWPTATQKDSERHETLERLVGPGKPRTGVTDQRPSCHVSTKGRGRSPR